MVVWENPPKTQVPSKRNLGWPRQHRRILRWPLQPLWQWIFVDQKKRRVFFAWKWHKSPTKSDFSLDLVILKKISYKIHLTKNHPDVSSTRKKKRVEGAEIFTKIFGAKGFLPLPTFRLWGPAFEPSSHHGSEKRMGCMSNRIVTFQIPRHFSMKRMIIGERLAKTSSFSVMFQRYQQRGIKSWN